MNIFLWLYDNLKTRHWLVATIWALLVVASVVIASHIRLKEDISDFITTDEETERYTSVFQQMGGQQRIVIVTSAPGLPKEERTNENIVNENIRNSEKLNKKLNDKIKLILLVYKLVDNNDKNIDVVDKKFAHGLHGIKIHEYEFFNKLVIPNMTFEVASFLMKAKRGEEQGNQLLCQNHYMSSNFILIC